MAELFGLFKDVSTFLKLAWVGWLIWGAVQIVWYRRARVMVAPFEPVLPDRSAERRPATGVFPAQSPLAPKPLAPAAANVTAIATIAEAPAPAPAVPVDSSETAAAAPSRRSKRGRRRGANSSGNVLDLAGMDETAAESEPA